MKVFYLNLPYHEGWGTIGVNCMNEYMAAIRPSVLGWLLLGRLRVEWPGESEGDGDCPWIPGGGEVSYPSLEFVL